MRDIAVRWSFDAIGFAQLWRLFVEQMGIDSANFLRNGSNTIQNNWRDGIQRPHVIVSFDSIKNRTWLGYADLFICDIALASNKSPAGAG
jgi:hypothetical protein